jgi:hypothetical protein
MLRPTPFVITLACACLWPLSLKAAALTYTEPFGLAHKAAVLSLPLDGPLDVAGKKLVDDKGREAPFQLADDGKSLLVRTDLAPRETLTWRLVAGKPAAGKGLVTLSRDPEKHWIEITNGFTGIRIPDGTQFTDEWALLDEKQKEKALLNSWERDEIKKQLGITPKNPAPVQGLQLADGRWTATGPNLLSAEPLLSALDVKVVEQGPLETVVRVHYSFKAKAPIGAYAQDPSRNPGYPGGDGQYTCTITVKADDPVIRFEEYSDRVVVNWQLNIFPELPFDTARHPAGKVGAIKATDTTDFTHQPPWTEQAFGRLWPKGEHPYSNTYYLLYDSKAGDDGLVVGAFVDVSGRSQHSNFAEASVFRSDKSGGISKSVGFSSPDAIVRPFVRHAWGLVVGRKKDLVPPLDKSQPIDGLMSRFAGTSMSLRQVAGPIPEIPRLDREERSDWINVKTAFGAKGDGRADDAPAIQAALDSLKGQGYDTPNTVYLPPGVYRITKTLSWKNLYGKHFIGHGRDTRIVWDGDGSTPPVMFHSDGATAGVLFEGIVWDGAGKAAHGVCHCSSTHYESAVVHRHEAFINMGTGVFSGESGYFPYKNATAEVMFRNCLFANVGHGLVFLSYNALDNSVLECEFRHCGSGIRNITGNVYVRDCHFEHSREWDIYTHVGDCSALRCTSTGSERFLHNSGRIFTMQDCHVDGWRSPKGAVEMQAGPLTIFDCTFTTPPAATPPIQGGGIPVLISNCTSPGTEGVLAPALAKAAVEVPAGKLGSAVTSARQSFFRSEVPAEGKVFDAMRDFGAKGDGKADDTDAILATVAAARDHGRRAIAYLPVGQYVVKKTIEITGSDYCVAGAGCCWQTGTRVAWGGPPPEEGGETAVVRVKNARGVSLEGFRVGTPSDYFDDPGVVSILHEASDAPSFVHYDDVGGFGRFRGLGPHDRVRIGIFGGILEFDSCGRGTVVVDQFHPSRHPNSKKFQTTLLVKGRDQAVPKDGLVGFMTFYNSQNPFDVTVQDSQSLVVSDYYTEQTWRVLLMKGNQGDTPGRVTLLAHKFHGEHVDDLVNVKNYRGELFLSASPLPQVPITDPEEAKKASGGTMSGVKVKTVPVVFAHEGDNPFAAVFASSMFEGGPPVIRVGPAVTVAVTTSVGGPTPGELTPVAKQLIVSALDDLRRLGKADLEVRNPPKAPGGSRWDDAIHHPRRR